MATYEVIYMTEHFLKAKISSLAERSKKKDFLVLKLSVLGSLLYEHEAFKHS